MTLIENMAGSSFSSPCLLLPLAAFLLVSDCNTVEAAEPRRPGAAGVFMLIEGGRYTFNFTSARDACLSLNASVATQAQMEQALQRGLETCKFGWIAEAIVVIPRLSSDPNCGKGNTGVVTWPVSRDRTFAVYCFNASALEETTRSTTGPQISTSSTSLLLPAHISTAATSPSKQTTSSPALITRVTETKSDTSQTSPSSAFNVGAKTTHPVRTPSTSTTLRTPSTHRPTPPPLAPSQPSAISYVSSTSEHVSTFSASSRPSASPSVGADKQHSLGDVPTAFIILGIVLILLTAAGVVLYYKLNIFAFWPRGQQKDDIETEMWKQADSEMDLHSRCDGGGEEEEEEGEEDEEEYRKYSSDITLCVKPDMKTESFE